MATTNLPIKAVGKHRALHQINGRVQTYVKVFGRLLGVLEDPKTGKKEKLDPDLNAILVSGGGYLYCFATTDDETCAEALTRLLTPPPADADEYAYAELS